MSSPVGFLAFGVAIISTWLGNIFLVLFNSGRRAFGTAYVCY